MKKIILGIVFLFFIGSHVHAREITDLFPEKPGELFCWKESITAPRPIRMNFIMINLDSKDLEIIAIPGDDPDGNGPAESQLTLPSILFNKFNAIAAINANAFEGLNDDKKSRPKWYDGEPVDIHGLVVSEGKAVSPVEKSRMAFWLDKNQNPHIGKPTDMSMVDEAVADWFSPLIVNSKIMPDTSDSALHPRTAIGFDNSGKWLLLVVVDGRQPGYSEGVTLYELAKIMQVRGCTQSVNLDGGGSSIMLIRDFRNTVKTVNRPSDGKPRPVPVLLGVRKKEK